jgi:predicted chitinase
MNIALQKVLSRLAPRLNYVAWSDALDAAFARFGLDTPRRQAMAMGQFLVEAGATFGSTSEGLNYVSAQRLLDIFPSHFPDLESTRGYLNNPVALANYVYANKEGNGDVASGDGWRYRGRGLIQITCRDAYAELANDLPMDLSLLPEFCETPQGAAMSGCWFLSKHGCPELADKWDINQVTRIVAGPSMGFASERLAYSNQICDALEYAAAQHTA